MKRDANMITTIDNNISKQFISMNQNDILSNNNTNLNMSKTQELESGTDKGKNQHNPIYVNSSYSREYINELKTVFENEKKELLFKNRSLQNHVERLKATFAEEVTMPFIKIANLQNQVDQMNSKYSSTTKFIEDDYKYKYEKAMKEKDDEVKKLMSKINDLLEYNDKLNLKVDENLTIIEDLRKNYSDKIYELQVCINNKEIEMNDMKSYYESKINSLLKTNEEEKSRIVSNYEQNFDKLNNGHTVNKEKLSTILNEREKDLQTVLEKQQTQERTYNELINELKREIAVHKENIISLKSKNNSLEHELEMFSRNLEGLKRDSTEYFQTIKILENENINLNKEKNDLKLEVSKLERIVYGKSRKMN